MSDSMRHCLIAAALAAIALPVQADDCANGIAATNPTSAYADHGDGTATDQRTGLTWKRCSEGQSWVEGQCSGEASTMSWQDALAAASSSRFAGHQDWRVPNVRELRSIVELCRVGLAINQTLFAGTEGKEFWTATPSTAVPGAAWFVDFHQGMSYSNGGKGASKGVRLVRTSTLQDSTPADAAPLAEPPSKPEAEGGDATSAAADQVGKEEG